MDSTSNLAIWIHCNYATPLKYSPFIAKIHLQHAWYKCKWEWNAPKMECTKNGMLQKWNAPKMESSKNGMLQKWNAPKMECSKNGMLQKIECSKNGMLLKWKRSFRLFQMEQMILIFSRHILVRMYLVLIILLSLKWYKCQDSNVEKTEERK